ncbi:hypothetical protein MTR67_016185 [Solanum verrucosum]|uniref:Adenylate isopentenyltransferase n=1 Tax=Solanum verrucosum TaxID=315347 RepID=A0AAF0QKB6_SOLVR|nr:hypothetical protein MTR67_016185 [Solanum verrucosum]
MGATGCGKSKLSIDLATHFFPSIEVINSDKIQVFNGLDITTNKISMTEREFKPTESHPEFSSSDFRSAGDFRINEIVNRGKIPFIVGGSNSFIYALLSLNPVINELRYQCCFIWVDAIAPVLNQYLDKRVDEMLDSEMFEELKEYFEKEGFSDSSSDGIRKAIGVPEFEKYFKGKISYEEAAMEIKENTRVLAERQVKKIMRLREGGWNIQKVDATATLTAKMGSEKMAGGENPARKIWEEQVLEPSAKIVKQFLLE